jgi:hypothetical protein
MLATLAFTDERSDNDRILKGFSACQSEGVLTRKFDSSWDWLLQSTLLSVIQRVEDKNFNFGGDAVCLARLTLDGNALLGRIQHPRIKCPASVHTTIVAALARCP